MNTNEVLRNSQENKVPFIILDKKPNVSVQSLAHIFMQEPNEACSALRKSWLHLFPGWIEKAKMWTLKCFKAS